MVNLRLNTMRNGLDPKIIHVVFVVYEVTLGRVLLREFEFRSKRFLNIYVTKIVLSNLTNYELVYKEISEYAKPTSFKKRNLHKTETF